MMNNTAPFPGLWVTAVNKLFESYIVLFLGSCLLRVIHHLYSFYLLLANYVSKLHSALRFVKRLRTDNVECCDDIRKEVLGLKKAPANLVLILGPEAASYRDIVKLITWCIPAGISHVSVYDHKNGLDCWQLYETFCSVAKQHLHKIKWGRSFEEEVRILSKKRINGYSWNPAVTVQVFQARDGLQSVADTVKVLHAENVEEIKLHQLNHLMHSSNGMPDPDLAIICGPTFTFFGCCPWNMRVTQMQTGFEGQQVILKRACPNRKFIVSRLLCTRKTVRFSSQPEVHWIYDLKDAVQSEFKPVWPVNEVGFYLDD